MLIFDDMQARGHEAVSLLHHAPSGLRAVLAIHSAVLGPAIAGVRLREQDEELAVRGALALSESLTLKAALAGLNHGGGACVLLMPPGGVEDPHAREALFRALGRQVRPLHTRVVLTGDVGVTAADIAFVAQETPGTLNMAPGEATGTFAESGAAGTGSVTGYGVYRGMKAAARYALGSESLRGVRVAVLGAGAVGRALATQLHREGARLTVAHAHRVPRTQRKSLERLTVPSGRTKGRSARARASRTGPVPAWRSTRVAMPAERNARSASSWLG